MQARFIWAGRGKDVSADQAFTNSSGWVEYGPIISWQMYTSTSKHSAEAEVVIPQHAAIIPATTGDVATTYGVASINAGDHVFIQDMESFINGANSFAIPGWPILQGTIDSVKYENNIMRIHFRNPLSYLADNYVRPGVTKANSQFNNQAGISPPSDPATTHSPIIAVTSTTARYVPNYSAALEARAGKIISDLVNYLAGSDVAGPFRDVNIDPNNAIDGTFIPNWSSSNNKISILNAILDVCKATQWSNNLGMGWEIQANPIPTNTAPPFILSFGFSTELFCFRRGYYDSQLLFDYHGQAGSNIIDYSFPEQTYDGGTTGASSGMGTSEVPLEEVASAFAFVGLTQISNSLLNFAARNGAGYESAGRTKSRLNSAATEKGGLARMMMGNLNATPFQGTRVGQIRVGGWLNAPLYPGFLATINIPEAGLNNVQFIIDDISYSEPEGITTVGFNRI